ncbi:hypothetical protein PR048_019029 [Dryococelus australis]|uniref:3-dehydrosphinganine reductase n=1 Tax=Dryococelus australis TaxID=614101 RepID=A0ABQ9H2P6_9NEOP|nr:hypothetical protein PR048_019029 [Dryococelus australis]
MTCLFMFMFPFILLLILKKFVWNRENKSLENVHVVVTGGSSGIGKCVAIEVARRGAHVTLVARDVEKLEATKVEVIKNFLYPEKQKVQYVSLDVSDNYEVIERALLSTEDDLGPIYMLVNCAGTAVCGRLDDMPVADIKNLVNLNFLGSVYPTRAVISLMKQRKKGCIVLVASEAAMLGIYGLTVYSGTKFAVRGLAEALHMEVTHIPFSFHLSLRADGESPGQAVQRESKPLETKLISESGGLVAPDVVAKQMISDALVRVLLLYVVLLMLASLCIESVKQSAAAPARIIYKVVSMLPASIASFVVLFTFQAITTKNICSCAVQNSGMVGKVKLLQI